MSLSINVRNVKADRSGMIDIFGNIAAEPAIVLQIPEQSLMKKS